ncbi:hypothetical protein G3T36_02120 [Diaminobutyricibacter tongyongensis]|uniref:DUF2384 domain-containing protein n=1 Tax=Leifsonia tongyongensis TaxID=1268043 RepID=A0A6L9XTS8_9MICO|nr:hypothetical protein [Diaminobutyricibacter tongyongensis]NEN04657.1 hypothetical protein [Diaminobutyricibacter tongyongensis]
MDVVEYGSWRRAGDEARELTIAQIATRRREVLGVRLVAYIGGEGTTSVVGAWVEGRAVPSADSDARLRTAFHALGILLERWDAVTIQSWFKGMNPLLGDVSPSRFLRERAPEAASDVLVAARFAMIS